MQKENVTAKPSMNTSVKEVINVPKQNNHQKIGSKNGSFRKMELNIEIEDNNFFQGQEETEIMAESNIEENLDSVENLNMPLKIAGSDLDDLMNRKGILESFRNHQIKLQQNNLAQPTGPDLNG